MQYRFVLRQLKFVFLAYAGIHLKIISKKFQILSTFAFKYFLCGLISIYGVSEFLKPVV